MANKKNFHLTGWGVMVMHACLISMKDKVQFLAAGPIMPSSSNGKTGVFEAPNLGSIPRLGSI